MNATLADSFLADVEDLSDSEVSLEEEVDVGNEAEEDEKMVDVALNYHNLDAIAELQRSERYRDTMKKVDAAMQSGTDSSQTGVVSEDDPEYQLIVDCNALSVDIDIIQVSLEEEVDVGNEAEEEDEKMVDVALNYHNLDAIAKLQKSERYRDTMKKVDAAMQNGTDSSQTGVVSEDDPEYQLIVDCNALSVDIDNEIITIHNFIQDKYRLKFPELESLVLHPIDYCRLVKRIGNEMDLTLVDLQGLLSSATIMVVSVTASTTSGKPLSDEDLVKTLDACDRALTLDEAKKKVLEFVESRMGYIAPNLSATVGSAVAAKLMGVAGGLSALAKMPAGNVSILGAQRQSLAGFSTASANPHTGFVYHTEIVQSTPAPLRLKSCRLVAAKATLPARIDATRGDPWKAGERVKGGDSEKDRKVARTPSSQATQTAARSGL